MNRFECGSGVFDVDSELDWRLQAAGLATGIIFAELPHFGPYYTGNQTAFVSSWNTILSTMQYLLIASLVLIVLGIVWSGPIGRPSAWIQMFISFGVGSWMMVGLMFLGMSQSWMYEDCCRQLIPAVAPLDYLLPIGLLIPTLSFASSLAWLFWDDRHRLEASIELSAHEIRRRQFEETTESAVASVVASIMLLFGLVIIFAAPSGLLLIVPAGVFVIAMIALSILVFVLEVSKQRKTLG